MVRFEVRGASSQTTLLALHRSEKRRTDKGCIRMIVKGGGRCRTEEQARNTGSSMTRHASELQRGPVNSPSSTRLSAKATRQVGPEEAMKRLHATELMRRPAAFWRPALASFLSGRSGQAVVL